MKLLVIGMDGVDHEVFQRGWTPNLQSLIATGESLDLEEDLISRGWAEIILGQHASRTGAVYEGPKADGTHAWSDKYKLSDTIGLHETVTPIWDRINEAGYKVGVMNVPTTFPAPAISGFFVSGGGGGGPIGQSVSAHQCHPKWIAKKLGEDGYIVDERVPSLLGEKKLFDPFDFFSRLELMNSRRTKSFVRLAKSQKIDFGMLVYRSTVTAETLALPEFERSSLNLESTKFLSATESFYRTLDNEISNLISNFPGTKIILVSDHSMALRKYSVNLNVFLSESGLQVPSRKKGVLYTAIKKFKHLIPGAVKNILKRNGAVKSSYESMTTFDKANSLAFCMSFSNGQHGIFVNDCERFGGPVQRESKAEVIKQIVSAFNSFPECTERGFKAIEAPSNRCPQFPDVLVNLPDGYLTSSDNRSFITEYQPDMSSSPLKEAAKGRLHSIKGHKPLAVLCGDSWKATTVQGAGDLTAVYNEIVARFPSRE